MNAERRQEQILQRLNAEAQFEQLFETRPVDNITDKKALSLAHKTATRGKERSQ